MAGSTGRIISACAEQTTSSNTALQPNRDHLRVCGADLAFSGFPPTTRGSSPRVRSRQAWSGVQSARNGIISACAEQTRVSGRTGSVWWDHLRVCGADHGYFFFVALGLGSSPRVRSRLPSVLMRRT